MVPTLLIVGGEDHGVLEINRLALTQIRCFRMMEVVPGATHLFVEPGAMEQVTRLATDWFETYLTADPT